MFKFEKVKRFEGIDIEAPARKTKNAAAYDMVAAEDVVVMPMTYLSTSISNIITKEKLTPEISNLIEETAGTDMATAQSILNAALTCSTQEISGLTKATGFKPTLISTGYKAYMPEDYSLDLYIRSSSPLKYWLILANSTGIIDADYADNEDNEGEIFFQVINLLPVPLRISKGEIIGQAKFVRFEKTDDDAKQEKLDRTGGFGSTTEVVE